MGIVLKHQHNGTWLTTLNTSNNKHNRKDFVIMPYRGISYGKAVAPTNDFNGTISHYLQVFREKNSPGDPVLYPSADTYLVFCLQAQDKSRAVICGPRSFPRIGEYVTNDTNFFVVGLTPLGSYAFLPLCQNELTDKAFDLDSIFPKWANHLAHQVNQATEISAKINIFENFMRMNFDRLRFQENEFTCKINHFGITADYRKFMAYYKSLNYTDRHTRRLFLKYTGVSPKKFMQILRCKDAMKRMMANPQTPMADIAYCLDYYDQAHFINEFKTFYDTTPLQFIKDFLS